MSRSLLAALLAALPLAAGAAAPSGGSPRWGSFEIGAHKYRPDLDADLPPTSTGPSHPYEDAFGTGRGLMFEVGLSRVIHKGFGSLEAGFRTGFFQDEGNAIVVGSNPPVRSPEETKFKIIPTSVSLTYRLDGVPERWTVPLAPYVRATLERYNWWATDGVGDTAERGATNGWSVTGGVGLLLDFFDRALAREFDRDQGVNHTYLFFEVTHSSIDDFGSSSSWDLSDEELSLGGGLLFVF